MESPPVLCKVPNPTIPVRDIMLHTFVDSRDGRTISPAYLLRSSSLKGKRLISEFFYMLGYLIGVVNADEYYLQRLDDDLRPLPGTVIKRSSLGTIIAGNYLIRKSP
ncbi:hypothetical protein PILCRDRAFT_8414 [Piloderma croceum F 1598]|uniref:Uncharacterized protein n=1 Tax=Piloderma croceum (strain F 1598) TaxID=765440 RepID=A0A0C3FPU1_PILCF|nr:hypothetical protein PILCRDRAFT_8414 [Piloderma croceum F 1598]